MKYTTALTLLSFSGSISQVIACTTQGDVTVTFYGYPDNDPPGPATAHNCGGRNYIAGGTGTYNDPVTFATASGEYNVCEIIYLPYLQKYIRYEDNCAQCTTDWHSKKRHIDIWTGSPTGSGGQQQIDCENSLTPGEQTVVRFPTPNLKVDAAQLYRKGASPACATSHTYPNAHADNYC